jgi:hypothetical protein
VMSARIDPLLAAVIAGSSQVLVSAGSVPSHDARSRPRVGDQTQFEVGRLRAYWRLSPQLAVNFDALSLLRKLYVVDSEKTRPPCGQFELPVRLVTTLLRARITTHLFEPERQQLVGRVRHVFVRFESSSFLPVSYYRA